MLGNGFCDDTTVNYGISHNFNECGLDGCNLEDIAITELAELFDAEDGQFIK